MPTKNCAEFVLFCILLQLYIKILNDTVFVRLKKKDFCISFLNTEKVFFSVDTLIDIGKKDKISEKNKLCFSRRLFFFLNKRHSLR